MSGRLYKKAGAALLAVGALALAFVFSGDRAPPEPVASAPDSQPSDAAPPVVTLEPSPLQSVSSEAEAPPVMLPALARTARIERPLPPNPAIPRAPEPTSEQRVLAAMSKTLEASPRLAPFLKAIRELHLDSERETEAIIFLRSKCTPGEQQPAPAGPASPQAMRIEEQTLHELWMPLRTILGAEDAVRLMPAVTRQVVLANRTR